MTEQTNHSGEKWTSAEDQVLSRYVKARPQNLSKCFASVSEQLGRTKSAVAYRWYSKVSKDPRNTCFSMISPRQVTKNRKNIEGAPINGSIWRRIFNIIRGL